MKYSFMLVFLIGVPFTVHAQYAGGIADGIASVQAKGALHSLAGIYSGGEGDGHAGAGSTILNTFPEIYAGGPHDGAAMGQAKGIQHALADIYTGGGDDGFSSAEGRTRNQMPGIYAGGADDGVTVAFAPAQHSTAPIYLGGNNDGASMAGSKGSVHAIPSIYTGGTEDGHAITVSLSQHKDEQVRHNARTLVVLELAGAWFNDNAVLGWACTPDSRIRHFEIERNEGGETGFRQIGTVLPNPDTAQHEYRYNDIRAYYLNTDRVLYRLKAVDKEGGFRVSAIVELTKDKSAPVYVVYPNPSSGRFNLVMLNVTDAAGYVYVLRSTDGKVVQTGPMPGPSATFDLRGAAAATYHLTLFRNGKFIQHFTILLTP